MRVRVWISVILSLLVLSYTAPQAPPLLSSAQEKICCCIPSECQCSDSCSHDSAPSQKRLPTPVQLLWENTGCKGNSSDSTTLALGSKGFLIPAYFSFNSPLMSVLFSIDTDLYSKSFSFNFFRPPEFS